MSAWRYIEEAKGRDLKDESVLEYYFEAIRLLEGEDFDGAHRESAELRGIVNREASRQRSMSLLELYYRTLLFDAPYDFDSYCIYIERDRENKFYLPRRKQLREIASSLQDLSERKIKLLGVSLPPGVGKTTLAIMFLTWLAGKRPEQPKLTGSHNNAFLRGVYDECLRITGAGEYLWRDVFPDVETLRTNAQDMMIDYGVDKSKGKRFGTLEFSSIGSGNAGKVRAEDLLYCDDLVDGIESALSRERMDKLWGQYTTDLRQRKIGDCCELHIATRWSVHDVIGRLKVQYEGSPDARFIAIPALNEEDESNFDYGNAAGFTTSFYHEQREIMDDVSWRSLYMNEPIEREGQLYAEGELRRYFELPDREPDAILSVCDTKDKGTDYCVMPVAYQYGQDYYIEDVICDNSDPGTLDARLVSCLLKHKVHMSRFESNSAGGRTAEKVQAEVKKGGGRTRITTKYTTTNKETRIIMASPFVKERLLFKDSSVIKQDKEYRRMLGFLCSYTMAGKNRNDDVPDAFSMLVDFVEALEVGKVGVMRRPF